MIDAHRLRPKRSEGWPAATFLLRDAKPPAAAEKSRRPVIAHGRSGPESVPSAGSLHQRTKRGNVSKEGDMAAPRPLARFAAMALRRQLLLRRTRFAIGEKTASPDCASTVVRERSALERRSRADPRYPSRSKRTTKLGAENVNLVKNWD